HGDLIDAAPQRVAARALQRRAHIRRNQHTGRGKTAVAAHYDVGAARQRPAQRLERLAPHHHGLAPGARTKTPHVRLEPPRQRVVPTDDAVFRDSRDKYEGDRALTGSSPRLIAHTATCALMCGCGSYPSSAKSS